MANCSVCGKECDNTFGLFTVLCSDKCASIDERSGGDILQEILELNERRERLQKQINKLVEEHRDLPEDEQYPYKESIESYYTLEF